MTAVSLENVSVTFSDGTKGLDSVSLDVEKGEFIALVGPSGSGKTTLLRTIAGFATPSQGKVLISGKDQTHTPPESRHLGMVFQQHAVWPHMTVFDNVAYPLKRAKVSRDERRTRTEDVLSAVGLAEFAGRHPDSLSGGQRQRVAIARAIVNKPELLLLDEALSALDEPLRDQMRRELVALTKRSGLTTIHVTHDRSEALSVADRVVVLHHGTIQQVAAPDAILNEPASEVVASFMSDATAVPAVCEGGVVVARFPDHELHLNVDSVSARTPVSDGSEVHLLIAPQHVEVVPAEPAPDVLVATVTSVLNERSGFSVSATVDDGSGSGLVFRTSISGSRPAEGSTIGLKNRGPWMFG